MQSPFDRADGDAFGEALLEDQVDDEGGEHGDHQSGEEQAEVALVLRLDADACQAERQRFQAVAVQKDQAEQVCRTGLPPGSSVRQLSLS